MEGLARVTLRLDARRASSNSSCRHIMEGHRRCQEGHRRCQECFRVHHQAPCRMEYRRVHRPAPCSMGRRVRRRATCSKGCHRPCHRAPYSWVGSRPFILQVQLVIVHRLCGNRHVVPRHRRWGLNLGRCRTLILHHLPDRRRLQAATRPCPHRPSYRSSHRWSPTRHCRTRQTWLMLLGSRRQRWHQVTRPSLMKGLLAFRRPMPMARRHLGRVRRRLGCGRPIERTAHVPP